MNVSPPAGKVYGSTSLPTQIAWNPAKYGAEAAAAQGIAGAIPADGMGTVQAVLPLVVVVVIIWLLAERHAKIRAGERVGFST